MLTVGKCNCFRVVGRLVGLGARTLVLVEKLASWYYTLLVGKCSCFRMVAKPSLAVARTHVRVDLVN